jgi:hypothetical protein
MTPYFFVNGRRLAGAQPFETFTKVIDEELATSGAQKIGERSGTVDDLAVPSFAGGNLARTRRRKATHLLVVAGRIRG